jgi:hypothetical protein
MFSKRKARLVVFAAVAATLGGGLFVYVTPASTNVNPAPVDDRLGIADSARIRPWGEDLSAQAVGSGGIERDLDGNASALFALDQLCGLPACGNPRQP